MFLKNTTIVFEMSKKQLLKLQSEERITNNFTLKAKPLPNNRYIVTFILTESEVSNNGSRRKIAG